MTAAGTTIDEDLHWRDMPFEDAPSLGRDEVHAWRAQVSREARRGRAILADAERERAQRFRLAEDRQRFEVTRSLLRVILGRYLNRPPASLRFSANAFGKPFIDDTQNPGTIMFNVAHSGDCALLAFGCALEVGVDVEDLRIERGIVELGKAVLTPPEYVRLLALPEGERKADFLQTWTRREALGKALGVGISAVTGAPQAPADPAEWCLRDLDVGEHYVAALAARARHVRLRLWNGT